MLFVDLSSALSVRSTTQLIGKQPSWTAALRLDIPLQRPAVRQPGKHSSAGFHITIRIHMSHRLLNINETHEQSVGFKGKEANAHLPEAVKQF